jgi:pSer/pThr/pTyr-binding forkhead associated (FHA) protein
MIGSIALVLRFLMAVILYAFLGWALFSLWYDIKQHSALLASRKVPAITLIITSSDSNKQKRYYIQPEVIIGRDPSCECPINDEAASARHARLSYHHGHWWLEDMASTNGTLLNDENLSMPTVVMSDDKFMCGQTTFRISLIEDIILPTVKGND